MKQVTKIIVKNGRIIIYHSDEVIDKREHYAFVFDSMYKGATDWCVQKNNINKVISSPLECVLYISTVKFYQDINGWIGKVVEAFRDKYGGFHWYREPIIEI